MTKRNRFSGFRFRQNGSRRSPQGGQAARPISRKSEIERGEDGHGAPQISSACRAGNATDVVALELEAGRLEREKVLSADDAQH